jgi:GT2 family glycosyltransferase
LLNPDTLVPAGAIAGLVRALEAEPDIGVVGPKLVLADGSLDPACRRAFPTPAVAFYRFSGLARLFPASPRFGRYNMTYLDPDQPADVDAVVGACMLLRGEAIAAVGLLDERFWMYGEDLDLALRIHRAGWRVAYRPQVVIHHVKRAASRASPQARYEFQRAMWLFYLKHYAASTPRPVHGLVLLGLALRGGPRLLRDMRAAGGVG